MNDARHDFDFLFGNWNVRNRRLRDPLTGSTDWYEFDATCSENPILGGAANLEQYDAPDTPSGPIHAIAVRLFDAQTQQWSINWSTEGSGSFLVPVVGRFESGTGTFYAREDYKGRAIVVRLTWTQEDATHCHWEQAFSPDDGASWETNWLMDFSAQR
jgi:hypothetical protein